MQRVPIARLSFDHLSPVIGARSAVRLRNVIDEARVVLDGRVVWHINSSAQGGGVAEMLQTLLAYECGAGLDVRWLVTDGDGPYFNITKRIHHRLHGQNGDGGLLSTYEHKHFARVTKRNGEQVLATVRSGDIVVLHDPQTIGLTPVLRRAGALVVWRCHIGQDEMNRAADEAWQFLRPYVEQAHACIFSRAAYVPAWLSSESAFIIPPAIDALSTKNQSMSRATARNILTHIGLLAGYARSNDLEFTRLGRSPGRVTRRAEIIQTRPVPGSAVPLVVQVSRWDPLKDMAGVLHGFADQRHRMGDAHLALVGPDPRSVTDDPEGLRVFQDCVAQWAELAPSAQERIHLVCLPMADIDENAAMVNASQRHAAVVVQKSLREGFGLTVTEAMYKGRPVVASKVGGIQDQIADGVHGLLVNDPTDTLACGDAIARLLADKALARRLGRNARRRAIAEFLAPRQLIQLLDLLYAVAGKPRRLNNRPKKERRNRAATSDRRRQIVFNTR
ncbi:MAG: glycosyltransferase [Gammaproteobacteria bacterium]|nr:glycosyltransferase [Gammaproteobacteria bacterium]